MFLVNKFTSFSFSIRMRLIFKDHHIVTTEELNFLGAWFNTRLTLKMGIDTPFAVSHEDLQ